MFNVIYSWSVIILMTIVFGIYGVLLSLIAPNILAQNVFRPWAKTIFFLVGIKVEASGFENIPEGPCIFMYNHQSEFDVLAFMAVLPVEYKTIMKREVIKMPFIGWIALLAGHYLVSRDGSARDANEVRKIVRNLKDGPPVVLAPEGTRSPDGKLQDFQEGGFLIAMMARVPVVSIIMQGGYERRSKTSRGIVPGTMKVTIMPPIDVSDLPKGKEGRLELMRIVKSQMEGVLDKDEAQGTG